MSQPSIKSKPSVCSPQILQAFTTIVRRSLPMDLQDTRITSEDLFTVLTFASVHQTSIDTACQELEGAPSGNRLREVLGSALPPRPLLQRRLNRALRSQVPRQLFKGQRSYGIALDIVLIPYHGQPQADAREVLRAEAKSGTNQFHGYATVSIVHDRRRYVLALRFVAQQETMVAIVRDLLNVVTRLKIRIRRVYLDKEFYSIAVFKTLDRRHLGYVVPIPVRGRTGGAHALCQGRRSYLSSYTLRSRKNGCYTVSVAVVKRNRRHGQKRFVRWFVFACSGLAAGTTPHQVFEWYRQRFGIETSYRQLNQVRARTSSRNPQLRLLLVGLALLLINLYVTLRTQIRSRGHGAPRIRRLWLTLRRLALLLARAIEMHLGISSLVQQKPVLSFS